MRLGIFGGSFDPVHYGHLLLAESCREQVELDAVWFLPSAISPHKQDRQAAPVEARVEMLELAIAGHPQFAVCRYEVDRGGVNYTVETLAALRAADASRELFLLLGGDSLADLPTWRDPAGICELATLVVVARAGHAAPKVDGLSRLLSPGGGVEARACEVSMPAIDLSASEIRRRVAAGASVRYRTPRAVEKYLETHRLYQ
jgi:nicotinate-nucleotide adenylyltransferase